MWTRDFAVPLMLPVFEWTLSVRSYEIGDDDAVNHATVAQWFQETAFQASAAMGFGSEYYDENGVIWLMRGLDIEFLAPARYGDEVACRSWVSDMRRVRSHREYEARRVRDGELIARARADWVYLDRATLTLKRIDPALAARFAPNHTPALVPLHWHDVRAQPDAKVFESARRVQFYEHDNMRHVNNAVYVAWLEQQMVEAWRAWQNDAGALGISRHEIEYRQQAQFGDTLQFASYAVQLDGKYFWHHRITRGGTIVAEANSLTRIDSVI